MSSGRRENVLNEEEDEDSGEDEIQSVGRSSLVARNISLSQSSARFGEITLVLFPYLILILDIFIYFLLRGFKFNSFDGSIHPDSQ